MSDQDELNKFDWLLDDLLDIGGVDGVEARDRQCAIKVKLSKMFEKQQAAAREADRLAELLKRCEWEAGGWCPICRERMNHGHAPGCELARALRGEG
jgi:hypothetical protein